MPPALTAAGMREADRLTIERLGLPGFTLMETAGRAAVDAIERKFGPAKDHRFVIFCGKGNNGGDGLVVARVLHARGACVDVVALTDATQMSESAARNFEVLRQLEANEDGIRLIRSDNETEWVFSGADFLVDALLGTGLSSAPRTPVADIVHRINTHPRPTIALDVPTGLHTDTGMVLGEAVEAALTVTMGARKTGLLLGEGPRCAGTVEVAEIGIPAHILTGTTARHGGAFVTTDVAVREWLPNRGPDAHKYNVGLALVVAGSTGFTGAPVMAASAAARAGSGYVVCAVPEAIRPTIATKLTEIATVALPPDDPMTALAAPLGRARALLVGPGMGRSLETHAFIRTLLDRTELPLVLDADGLVAFAGHTEVLAAKAQGRWILTPHTGEFKRLAGDDVNLSDRVGTVREFARRWNCVLLLKGLPSVIGCPDGRVFINGTGNPALATAGTGDVLAGLCAGLLAQGLPPDRAAICALHLGGAAADRYAEQCAPNTMMATDLLTELPLVLHERFST